MRVLHRTPGIEKKYPLMSAIKIDPSELYRKFKQFPKES